MVGSSLTKQCIEKGFGENLVSHFKFLASMDIGERQKPQNGSLYLQMDGQEVYLRLSTLPTVYQESLVISKFSGKATFFYALSVNQR